MARIQVEICSRNPNILPDWEALVRRSSPNAFMHPSALNAVCDSGFAKSHLLLAWDRSATPNVLVGVWALQEQRVAPFLLRSLSAPPYNYAFISTPVIDPAHMDAVAHAFFEAIAASPSLPKLVRMKYLDGDTDAYAAIMKALSARRSRTRQLAARTRAFATRTQAMKPSGSTRKKLRQDWKRLSALGDAEVVNEQTPGGVRVAFETFLALEAASWKGKSGTALLCRDADAAFARKLINDLAASGNASVALLKVGGETVAAQVLLYCGGTAYTWKTAFDGRFAKYSPGALLVDKVTDQLFSTPDITAIDSCSPEGSFMSQLWTGQRSTIDVLADVRPTRSLGFALATVEDWGYRWLRRMRDKLKGAIGSALARPPRPAPARKLAT